MNIMHGASQNLHTSCTWHSALLAHHGSCLVRVLLPVFPGNLTDSRRSSPFAARLIATIPALKKEAGSYSKRRSYEERKYQILHTVISHVFAGFNKLHADWAGCAQEEMEKAFPGAITEDPYQSKLWVKGAHAFQGGANLSMNLNYFKSYGTAGPGAFGAATNEYAGDTTGNTLVARAYAGGTSDPEYAAGLVAFNVAPTGTLNS